MTTNWLDITDFGPEGRQVTVDDQAIWQDSVREYAMPVVLDCPECKPLVADLFVRLETGTVFIDGTLGGVVSAPCDRCAVEVLLPVELRINLAEMPPVADEQQLEPGLIRRVGRRLELDVAGLVWEQFVLALPVKPLCSPDCLGLCASCGADLNAGPCGCKEQGADPRLAVLSGLKINPKTPQ